MLATTTPVMPSTPSTEYTPRGTASRLIFRCQAPEVLISGPAGTGKSLACLWKLHLEASTNADVRALIVRKTRASVTESALVTFERDVLPPGCSLKEGAQRRFRHTYKYDNGSEIIVGGMDTPSRTLSTEYDLIYVQEAIELEENDWELLTRPLRNNKLEYQQILADTNPSTPIHWLKKRCDRGQTLMLESRHQDNPTLWDAKQREWTASGAKYLAKLDALTGARLMRLRHGRWVQAEGVVYEAWDPSIHIIDRRELPYMWHRCLSIDFGHTNPFVCQWWAIDPDGRLYRYREIYHTRGLVEDWAREIKRLTEAAHDPPPVCVICDHDAEDRATLERHLGREVFPALKDKDPGFQAVMKRLRRAGDGKPRIFFMRDSLVQRDQELDAAKKPCCTEEEFDGYVWNRRTPAAMLKEEPVKVNDHGMDAMRYMVYSLDADGAPGASGDGSSGRVREPEPEFTRFEMG